MTDEPTWGGCIGSLLSLAALVAVAYFGIGQKLIPWIVMQDNIASACPDSGVSRVVTDMPWFGDPSWTVTCLDGTVVLLDRHDKNGRPIP